MSDEGLREAPPGFRPRQPDRRPVDHQREAELLAARPDVSFADRVRTQLDESSVDDGYGMGLLTP